jgi:3-deoxy-manno-octulosonate cytidylyltransferase (CMP-KDO synthetase)
MLIYIFRAPLPDFKDEINAPKRFKKQVCIYGFSRNDLAEFSAFGGKSELEQAEDIEILRFFELNREIQMFECLAGSLAVDTPEDVDRVERALRVKAESE